jgi:hypothetical protein
MRRHPTAPVNVARISVAAFELISSRPRLILQRSSGLLRPFRWPRINVTAGWLPALQPKQANSGSASIFVFPPRIANAQAVGEIEGRKEALINQHTFDQQSKIRPKKSILPGEIAGSSSFGVSGALTWHFLNGVTLGGELRHERNYAQRNRRAAETDEPRD